ncbi:MAG: hypothetical protein MHM6MM_001781 [Cercozoa sp. M6MM]
MDETLEKKPKSASSPEHSTEELQRVLQLLAEEPTVVQYRAVLEHVRNRLDESASREQQLVAKVAELSDELAGSAQTVTNALETTAENQAERRAMRKELDSTRQMLENAREREQKDRRQMEQLRARVQAMTAATEREVAEKAAREDILEDLRRERSQLEEKTIDLEERVTVLEKHLTDARGRVRQSRQQIEDLSAQLNEEQKKMRALVRSEATEKKRVAKLQHEKTNLAKEAEKCQSVSMENKLRAEDAERIASRLSNERRKLLSESAKMQRKLEVDKKKLESGENALNRTESELFKLREEHAKMSRTFQKLESDLERATKTIEKQQDRLAHAQSTNDILRREKATIEKQRAAWRQELQSLSQQLQSQLGLAQRDSHAIESLDNELRRVLSKLDAARKARELEAERAADALALARAAENEALDVNKQIQDAERRTAGAFAAQQKAVSSAKKLQRKTQSLREQIQQYRNGEQALRMQISANAKVYAQQQSMYESLRAERNTLASMCSATKDEVAELRQAQQVMSYQVTQLKDEVREKNKALIASHFERKELEAKAQATRALLSKKQALVLQSDSLLASQDAEVRALRKTLSAAEKAQRAQKRVFDRVVDERDIVGAQLVRRQDEMILIEERCKRQQTALVQGEEEYSDRIEEVRHLQLSVRDLTRKLDVEKSKTAALEILKRETHVLQKRLLAEQTKLRALSEELENPINVHRWRQLADTSPSQLELLHKVQALQKRLAIKTEQCVELQEQVQDKQRQYDETKQQLSRMPGVDVVEQLNAQTQLVKEKTRQMRSLTAELNMLRAQCDEYKCEMRRMTHDMQELKRKYYAAKKDELLRREAMTMQGEDEMTKAEAAGPRNSTLGSNQNSPRPGESVNKEKQRLRERATRELRQQERARFVGGGFAVR